MIAETRQGRLRGERGAHGMLAFRGIPFAVADRFAPPRPPAPWDGVRDATAIGPIAPQNGAEFDLLALPPMSEDCLNLSLFTPALDDARRPVLVYIHAGAFVSGAGGGVLHDGSLLAADEDVVVIGINYRLGVLGWPPFDAGDGTVLNAGLLDQIAALEWIRDNVAAFGGDPENVTLFGYSAGGWSIVTLMATPRAWGLFHKVVPQSGSAFGASGPAELARMAAAWRDAFGDGDPRTAPLDALLDAQKRMSDALNNDPLRRTSEDLVFGPRIEAGLLDAEPLPALKQGEACAVPMLIGTTGDELGYTPFRAGIPWVETLHGRDAAIETLVRSFGAERGQAIWDTYVAEFPDDSDAGIAGRIRSDRYYRLPAIQAAEANAPRAPTWMYRFTLPATSPIAGNVSTHATDLCFWFGTMADSPFRDFFFGRGPTDEELVLSRRMRRDIAHFARTGQCDWPAYEAGERATRRYDLEDCVELDPQGNARRIWPT